MNSSRAIFPNRRSEHGSGRTVGFVFDHEAKIDESIQTAVQFCANGGKI
jgi:hypothetical protein